MREFIVGANETNIKVFNILEQSSVITLHNAHSDNIKKVQYLSEHVIMSASADKTIKLWDLRNQSEALSSLKLEWGAEDFCSIKGYKSD